jgi:hypothetical protein
VTDAFAPAPAAPAAAPAPWSAELAVTAATLQPEAAAARIESLKADKDFYAALQRKDGAAMEEWNALHKSLTAPPPPVTPKEIATEADIKAEEQQRTAAAWSESLAELRRNGAQFTAAQEQDILARRPISQQERDFHLNTIESYKRNPELGKKVLAKDPEHFTRYHLALQGIQLPVARP